MKEKNYTHLKLLGFLSSAGDVDSRSFDIQLLRKRRVKPSSKK